MNSANNRNSDISLLSDLLEKKSSIDIKKYILQVLAYWPLILLSVIIGTGLVFLRDRYTTPVYEISGTMLIDDENNNVDIRSLFGEITTSKSSNASLDYKIASVKSIDRMINITRKSELNISYYRLGRVKETLLSEEEIPIEFVSDNEDYTGKLRLEETSVQTFKLYDYELDELIGEFNYGQRIDSLGITINRLFHPNINVIIEVEDVISYAKGLASRVEITPNAIKDHLITISLKDPNIDKSKSTLREVMTNFIEEDINQKNETAVKTLSFIESQLLEIGNSLFKSEGDLQEFQETNLNAAGSLLGSNALIIEYQEVTKELKALGVQQDYYSYIDENLNENYDNDLIIPATVGIEDPLANSLVSRYNELQLQIGQLSTVASDINPTLVDAKRQLSLTYDGLKRNIEQLKVITGISEKRLKNERDSLILNINKIPVDQRKLVNIQRNYNLNEELYIFLIQKKAELEIQKAGNSSSIKILELPESKKKIYPNSIRDYQIALFLSLFIPAGIIILRYHFSNSIESVKEIEANTSIPVLGTVTMGKYKTELVMDLHPKSSVSEGFRQVRSSLKFYNPDLNQIRTILFTSFLSGDGKTFSAINTSIMMAKAGKKTILIGLDLRKPKIYQSFKLSNNKGMSTVLIKESSLEDAIQKTHIDNLDFLSAGPLPPNPNDLILSNTFDELINEIKSQYDYVIIDTPPVGLVSDASEISKFVDVSIYVIRYKKSPIQSLEYLNNAVSKGILNNTGILFNGVDLKRTKYGYGYGYYEEDK